MSFILIVRISFGRRINLKDPLHIQPICDPAFDGMLSVRSNSLEL